MLKRYAIFEGCVRPDMDSQMWDYVNDAFAPLCRQFCGVHSVRAMLGFEQDPHGFSFSLVPAIT